MQPGTRNTMATIHFPRIDPRQPRGIESALFAESAHARDIGRRQDAALDEQRRRLPAAYQDEPLARLESALLQHLDGGRKELDRLPWRLLGGARHRDQAARRKASVVVV